MRFTSHYVLVSGHLVNFPWPSQNLNGHGGDRAFASAAAHLWNRLPKSINLHVSESVDIFKSKLKTHLMEGIFLNEGTLISDVQPCERLEHPLDGNVCALQISALLLLLTSNHNLRLHVTCSGFVLSQVK